MSQIHKIIEGIWNGIVFFGNEGEGDIVCHIGEYWFYFGGETAEEMTASEYISNVPKKDIINEIKTTLDDLYGDETFEDEYDYYFAIINHN